MKEPGLDDRHRNEDSRIHAKRSDALNGNLSNPIQGFGDDVTVGEMRDATGGTSLADIRRLSQEGK